MKQAQTKTQKIRERIAQLSKIDSKSVFSPEELERRRKYFNLHQMYYPLSTNTEIRQSSSQLQKLQNKADFSTRPIFTLNTNFFRKNQLGETMASNLQHQKSTDKQSQNNKQLPNVASEQPQNKIIQYKQIDASNIEASKQQNKQLIKLNPVGENSKPLEVKISNASIFANSVYANGKGDLFNNQTATNPFGNQNNFSFNSSPIKKRILVPTSQISNEIQSKDNQKNQAKLSPQIIPQTQSNLFGTITNKNQSSISNSLFNQPLIKNNNQPFGLFPVKPQILEENSSTINKQAPLFNLFGAKVGDNQKKPLFNVSLFSAQPAKTAQSSVNNLVSENKGQFVSQKQKISKPSLFEMNSSNTDLFGPKKSTESLFAKSNINIAPQATISIQNANNNINPSIFASSQGNLFGTIQVAKTETNFVSPFQQLGQTNKISIFGQKPKDTVQSNSIFLNISKKQENKQEIKPVIEQKPTATVTSSLFGQSNTLNSPLFDFAKKTISEPKSENPSIFSANKNTLFDNKNSVLPFGKSQALFTPLPLPQITSQTNKPLFDNSLQSIQKRLGVFEKLPSKQVDLIQTNELKKNQNMQKSELQIKTQIVQKSQLIGSSIFGKKQENYEGFNFFKANQTPELKKQSSFTTAIGPGGKKIQVPLNSFGNITQKSIFSGNNSKPLLFSTGTTDGSNIFNRPVEQGAKISNLFTNPSSGSLFGGGKLFSSGTGGGLLTLSAQNNIFSQHNVAPQIPQGDNEEGEDQDNDDPIEAQDEANPQLSTGKYDYIKTQIFFKQNASKFRQGTKQLLQNVVISFQKFNQKPDRYIYVRMPNKCIVFTGKLLPKVTEVRSLNNSNKNLEIKKILLIQEDAGKPELVLLKIQFKDDTIGEKLLNQMDKFLKAEGQ